MSTTYHVFKNNPVVSAITADATFQVVRNDESKNIITLAVDDNFGHLLYDDNKIICQVKRYAENDITDILKLLYLKFKIEFLSEYAYADVIHDLATIEEILPVYMESFKKYISE